MVLVPNILDVGASKQSVSLEEALELTGFGRYNYELFALSNLILLAMVLNTFGVSVTITASARDLELDVRSTGILLSMPMLGTVLSAYFWGWLADTHGRKWVLVKTMWMTFVLTMIGSFSYTWEMLTVTKFLGSFFASSANSAVYALFGECTPLSQRNKFLLMLSSGLMCGPGFMAIIGYPVLLTSVNIKIPYIEMWYRSWRLLEQMFALVAGFSAILIMKIMKESPKFYASQANEKQCLDSLRQIYSINTGKNADEYPVSKIMFEETVMRPEHIMKSLLHHTIPFCQPPIRNNSLTITYIVVVVYIVSPTFLMWMPTLANSLSRAVAAGITDETFCHMIQADFNITQHEIDKEAGEDRVEPFTFISLLVVSSCLAILTITNSFLLHCISKRTLMLFYNVFNGSAGILIPFVYSYTISSMLFFVLVLNLLTVGIITSFTVELYPTYLRAMAVCLTIMIGRGCSLMTIRFTGIMLELYCEEMFFTYGCLVISVAFVSLLLPKDAITYGQANPVYEDSRPK